MDNPISKRQKTQKETAASDEGQDFISNLPEDVRCKILSYLSTRDAVRTCILSSKWRYTWVMIPELSVKEDDFGFSTASEQMTRARLVKFVDILLYLHNGPIFKFKLEAGKSCRENNVRVAFIRWILHLSRRKEFYEFSCSSSSQHLFYLPTTLFLCRGLSILNLHDCRINLPSAFEGFKLMRVLELQGCVISGDDIEKLVSSCPILDELVLRTASFGLSNPYNELSLKICAPKLKKLIIHGRFVSLLLKTPCLVKACFDLEVRLARVNGRANLVEVLGALPEVEVLGFHQQFFAYLAARCLPDCLPLTLDKLKILSLDVNLASPEEVSVMRLLLQNAPNLVELNLTNSTTDRGDRFSQTNSTMTCAGLWEIGSGSFFMSLRVVELYEFFISRSELAFLKFILASAPLLEQLTVIKEQVTDAREKEAVVEILKRIPKVSQILQITLE
ncbi:F-box family protein [Rhynchospora pubera]|uniref:F-box family protein n=1 Tax=Rhynchospora pubera TaxID=906938 RepID=A0AAV8F400_9POAL|nr:F-box family protein [Rhynchospora pubera]KAJ4786345.1 F-box family protein [Rhynchospora pubera]